MILLQFVKDLIKNCLLVIFVNKVFLTDEMLKFALVAANTLRQGELPFDTAGTTV